jgi:hypothetical protein
VEEVVDSVETEAVADLVVDDQVSKRNHGVEMEVVDLINRCLRLFVASVISLVRFLSVQPVNAQCIAENVLQQMEVQLQAEQTVLHREVFTELQQSQVSIILTEDLVR